MKEDSIHPEPELLVQHSLCLDRVLLPGHPPDWPTPLSLTLGLKEFLVIDGLSLAGAQQLLSVAAALQFPIQGRVRHWGQDLTRLSRTDLYQLHRRIAFISPGQVLLRGLTVVENITLPGRYFQRRAMREIIKDYSELIEHFGLRPYFSHYPSELPAEIYSRVLWAGALIKEPKLILAAPFSSPPSPENQHLILARLKNYRQQHQGAVLLTGPDLAAARPLADRLLRMKSGGLAEIRLAGQPPPPISQYLSFF
ncbi:MAG: hypothetical protein ACLFUU_07855 [Desulfobacteraceae bacterium]